MENLVKSPWVNLFFGGFSTFGTTVQQEQQSQSTSAGTIGLSNCVGRSEITTIALNDVGSSSFNHVIHPNHLNETALHHHHHASAENADASANGEHQSHFIYRMRAIITHS